MSEAEKFVKERFQRAELGFTPRGVRVVNRNINLIRKWWEPKHFFLSSSFVTTSEAWEDAARLIRESEGKR